MSPVPAAGGPASRSVTDPTSRLEALAAGPGARVLTYLRRRHGHDDADDLYSQTLAVAWRRLDEVPDGDGPAFAWLLTVARRLAANHHRSLTRRNRLLSVVRSQTRVGHGAHDPAVDRVQQALDRLDPVHRDLLTLVYWDGLSGAELAAVLDVPEPTARKRLQRARDVLRAELGAGAPGRDAVEGFHGH